MADFPILFTGKDVPFEPRTTGQLERSRKRFHEKFLEGERFKRAEKERGKGFFYKTLDLDPVQLSSRQITEEQERDLSGYNDTWTEVFTRQNGIITEAQQMEMFRDRQKIEAKQASMLATQSLFERDYELHKRDAMRATPQLDQPDFKERADVYFKEGTYQPGIKHAPFNMDSFIDKEKKTWGGNIQTDTITWTELDAEGKEITRSRKTGAKGTIGEAMDWVENQIMGDHTGRKAQAAVDKFLTQTEEVKAKYLPAFDGDVDTEAERNGIIEFARNYWGPKLLRESLTTTKKPATTSAGKKADLANLKIDGRIYDSNGNEILRWSDNVSGDIIGSGGGWEFTSTARTLDLSPNILIGSGDGKIIDQTIKARPIKMANGRVEYVTVRSMRKKHIVDIDKVPTQYWDKATPEDDGKASYIETVPAGSIIATTLKAVQTDLGGQLGGGALQQAIEDMPQQVNFKGFFKKVKDFFDTDKPATKPKEEIDFSQYKIK